MVIKRFQFRFQWLFLWSLELETVLCGMELGLHTSDLCVCVGGGGIEGFSVSWWIFAYTKLTGLEECGSLQETQQDSLRAGKLIGWPSLLLV